MRSHQRILEGSSGFKMRSDLARAKALMQRRGWGEGGGSFCTRSFFLSFFVGDIADKFISNVVVYNQESLTSIAKAAEKLRTNEHGRDKKFQATGNLGEVIECSLGLAFVQRVRCGKIK